MVSKKAKNMYGLFLALMLIMSKHNRFE